MNQELRSTPVLYSNDQIEDTIYEIANKILCFKGDTPARVKFVCILNGGFKFAAKLLEYFPYNEISIDFIKVKSYQGKEQSSFEVSSFDIECLEKDKNEYDFIYLIDDMIDSGKTIERVKSILFAIYNKSIKTICLFYKKGKKELVDYAGLVVPDDHFIAGYGLDKDEFYRNLPYVVSI